jgi:hypothetical protein
MKAFDGFRDFFAHSTYSGVSSEQIEPLTLEKLEKTFEYLNSQEYYELQRSRWERYEDGLQLIGYALQQNIITMQEFYRLLYELEMFGALVVSPQMGERLKQVKMPDPEARKEIKLPRGFYLLHTQEEQWYAMNGTEIAVYSRFAGPFRDEYDARKWCEEQHQILTGLQHRG